MKCETVGLTPSFTSLVPLTRRRDAPAVRSTPLHWNTGWPVARKRATIQPVPGEHHRYPETQTMINAKDNPVEWALLLHELEDAEEHLKDLGEQMISCGEISDEDYRITLGHIYSHINRAWNSRSRLGEQSDELFVAESRMPNDITAT